MVEAGGDLIEGLIEGIKKKWEDLKESVEEFGETVIETFCDFFDINSPSKVMEDMIGKNLALGIDVGFVGNIGSVSEDMSESLNSILDDMGTAELNANITGNVTPAQTADTAPGSYSAPGQPVIIRIVTPDRREVAEWVFPDLNELFGQETTLNIQGYASMR